MLPESVAGRVKSPYPTTSDPKYVAVLQEQAKALLTRGDDTLFGLLDRSELGRLVSLDVDRIERNDRAKLERALDLSIWLDMYKPEILV